MLNTVKVDIVGYGTSGVPLLKGRCVKCTSTSLRWVHSDTEVQCLSCGNRMEMAKNSSVAPSSKRTLFTSGTMVTYKYVGDSEALQGLVTTVVSTGRKRKTEQLLVSCPFCGKGMKGVNVRKHSDSGRKFGGVKYICPDKHSIGINDEADGWE